MSANPLICKLHAMAYSRWRQLNGADAERLDGMRAFAIGLVDGMEQPDDFTSGVTFHDLKVNLMYEYGVNVGQGIIKAVRGMKEALFSTPPQGLFANPPPEGPYRERR